MTILFILIHFICLNNPDEYFVTDARSVAYLYPAMTRIRQGDVILLSDSVVFADKRGRMPVISPTKGASVVLPKKALKAAKIPGFLIAVGDNIFPSVRTLQMSGSGYTDSAKVVVYAPLVTDNTLKAADDMTKWFKHINDFQLDPTIFKFVDTIKFKLTRNFAEQRKDSVFFTRYIDARKIIKEKQLTEVSTAGGLIREISIPPLLTNHTAGNPQGDAAPFEIYYGKVGDTNSRLIYRVQAIHIKDTEVLRETAILKKYLTAYYLYKKTLNNLQVVESMPTEIQYELNEHYGYITVKHIRRLLR